MTGKKHFSDHVSRRKGSRWVAMKEGIDLLLDYPLFIFIMTLATLYSLIGTDVRLFLEDKSSDGVFLGLTSFTLSLFIVEMILRAWLRQDYLPLPNLITKKNLYPPFICIKSVESEEPSLLSEEDSLEGTDEMSKNSSFNIRVVKRCCSPGRIVQAVAFLKDFFVWSLTCIWVSVVNSRFGSFYFWLDLASIVALILEIIIYVYDMSPSSALSRNISGGLVLSLTRIGRAARAGSRASRIIRGLIIFSRVLKARAAAHLAASGAAETDSVGSSSVEGASVPVRSPCCSMNRIRGIVAAWRNRIRENRNYFREARSALSSETRVGAELTSKVTKGVIIGMLLLVAIIPILSYLPRPQHSELFSSSISALSARTFLVSLNGGSNNFKDRAILPFPFRGTAGSDVFSWNGQDSFLTNYTVAFPSNISIDTLNASAILWPDVGSMRLSHLSSFAMDSLYSEFCATRGESPPVEGFTASLSIRTDGTFSSTERDFLRYLSGDVGGGVVRREELPFPPFSSFLVHPNDTNVPASLRNLYAGTALYSGQQLGDIPGDPIERLPTLIGSKENLKGYALGPVCFSSPSVLSALDFVISHAPASSPNLRAHWANGHWTNSSMPVSVSLTSPATDLPLDVLLHLLDHFRETGSVPEGGTLSDSLQSSPITAYAYNEGALARDRPSAVFARLLDFHFGLRTVASSEGLSSAEFRDFSTGTPLSTPPAQELGLVGQFVPLSPLQYPQFFCSRRERLDASSTDMNFNFNSFNNLLFGSNSGGGSSNSGSRSNSGDRYYYGGSDGYSRSSLEFCATPKQLKEAGIHPASLRTVSVITYYSQAHLASLAAPISLAFSLIVLVLLSGGSIAFTLDTYKLVLQPLEVVVGMLKYIAKNPLSDVGHALDTPITNQVHTHTNSHHHHHPPHSHNSNGPLSELAHSHASSTSVDADPHHSVGNSVPSGSNSNMNAQISQHEYFGALPAPRWTNSQQSHPHTHAHPHKPAHMLHSVSARSFEPSFVPYAHTRPGVSNPLVSARGTRPSSALQTRSGAPRPSSTSHRRGNQKDAGSGEASRLRNNDAAGGSMKDIEPNALVTAQSRDSVVTRDSFEDLHGLGDDIKGGDGSLNGSLILTLSPPNSRNSLEDPSLRSVNSHQDSPDRRTRANTERSMGTENRLSTARMYTNSISHGRQRNHHLSQFSVSSRRPTVAQERILALARTPSAERILLEGHSHSREHSNFELGAGVQGMYEQVTLGRRSYLASPFAAVATPAAAGSVSSLMKGLSPEETLRSKYPMPPKFFEALMTLATPKELAQLSSEFRLLLHTLTNLGSLLRLGFGSSGAALVTDNLSPRKELNTLIYPRNLRAVLAPHFHPKTLLALLALASPPIPHPLHHPHLRSSYTVSPEMNGSSLHRSTPAAVYQLNDATKHLDNAPTAQSKNSKNSKSSKTDDDDDNGITVTSTDNVAAALENTSKASKTSRNSSKNSDFELENADSLSKVRNMSMENDVDQVELDMDAGEDIPATSTDSSSPTNSTGTKGSPTQALMLRIGFKTGFLHSLHACTGAEAGNLWSVVLSVIHVVMRSHGATVSNLPGGGVLAVWFLPSNVLNSSPSDLSSKPNSFQKDVQKDVKNLMEPEVEDRRRLVAAAALSELADTIYLASVALHIELAKIGSRLGSWGQDELEQRNLAGYNATGTSAADAPNTTANFSEEKGMNTPGAVVFSSGISKRAEEESARARALYAGIATPLSPLLHMRLRASFPDFGGALARALVTVAHAGPAAVGFLGSYRKIDTGFYGPAVELARETFSVVETFFSKHVEEIAEKEKEKGSKKEYFTEPLFCGKKIVSCPTISSSSSSTCSGVFHGGSGLARGVSSHSVTAADAVSALSRSVNLFESLALKMPVNLDSMKEKREMERPLFVMTHAFLALLSPEAQHATRMALRVYFSPPLDSANSSAVPPLDSEGKCLLSNASNESVLVDPAAPSLNSEKPGLVGNSTAIVPSALEPSRTRLALLRAHNAVCARQVAQQQHQQLRRELAQRTVQFPESRSIYDDNFHWEYDPAAAIMPPFMPASTSLTLAISSTPTKNEDPFGLNNATPIASDVAPVKKTKKKKQVTLPEDATSTATEALPKSKTKSKLKTGGKNKSKTGKLSGNGSGNSLSVKPVPSPLFTTSTLAHCDRSNGYFAFQRLTSLQSNPSMTPLTPSPLPDSTTNATIHQGGEGESGGLYGLPSIAGATTATTATAQPPIVSREIEASIYNYMLSPMRDFNYSTPHEVAADLATTLCHEVPHAHKGAVDVYLVDLDPAVLGYIAGASGEGAAAERGIRRLLALLLPHVTSYQAAYARLFKSMGLSQPLPHPAAHSRPLYTPGLPSQATLGRLHQRKGTIGARLGQLFSPSTNTSTNLYSAANATSSVINREERPTNSSTVDNPVNGKRSILSIFGHSAANARASELDPTKSAQNNAGGASSEDNQARLLDEVPLTVPVLDPRARAILSIAALILSPRPAHARALAPPPHTSTLFRTSSLLRLLRQHVSSGLRARASAAVELLFGHVSVGTQSIRHIVTRYSYTSSSSGPSGNLIGGSVVAADSHGVGLSAAASSSQNLNLSSNSNNNNNNVSTSDRNYSSHLKKFTRISINIEDYPSLAAMTDNPCSKYLLIDLSVIPGGTELAVAFRLLFDTFIATQDEFIYTLLRDSTGLVREAIRRATMHTLGLEDPSSLPVWPLAPREFHSVDDPIW